LFIRGYGLGADAGVYGTLVSPDNEITGIFADANISHRRDP